MSNTERSASASDEIPADFFTKSDKPPEKYTASCHCAQIRYTVLLSPPLYDTDSKVAECNCSICARNGELLVYVPTTNVEFEDDSNQKMTKYTFGKHRVAHWFCSKCGSSLMCDSIQPGFFDGMRAINVRMFHDVDLKGFARREVDGKNLG